jgi:hypothetical protein
MSKEQLTNMAWDIITQIFAKANLLFITIGGSFIVLLNAYHIKQNSFLNGEWAKHVRRWGKKFTSGIRRQESKKVIHQELKTT